MTDRHERGQQSDNVQSVVFALRILEYLAGNPGARGVTEIAAELGTTKARIFRHLRTLVAMGYVVQDRQTEKYQIGIGLYVLGQSAGEQFNFITAARRVMRPLRDRLRQTVTISVIDEDGVLVVDMVRANTPFEIGTKPGSVFAFHATAQGKLALGFGPRELYDRTLGTPLRAMTPQTITNVGVLKEEIERVRRRGWATAPGEALPGLNALAAPIYQHGGELAGMIAILGSVQYILGDPDPEQIEAVTSAAREVSESLGYHGTPLAATA